MVARVVHCKKEPYDVYIGRGSKWGNPFIMGKHGTRAEVIEMYEEWLLGILPAPHGEDYPLLSDAKRELGGKILGCYCAPKACHGDYLLRMSNPKAEGDKSAKIKRVRPITIPVEPTFLNPKGGVLPEEKPLVLAIDSNAICHAAKHTTRAWIAKGYKTGVIYGYFSKLLTLIEEYQPTTLVFVWDTGTNIRKEIFSGYKNREPDQLSEREIYENDIAFAQFDQLRDGILSKVGFKNVLFQNGYEADDILAVMAEDPSYDLVIVSRDSDLYQLLSNSCVMFDPQAKVEVTEVKFTEKYGISPKEWGLVKAIAGCDSDTVDGVPDVGVVTAIKYIQGKLGKDTKTYQRIERSLDTIIARNAELVILPLAGVEPFRIEHGYDIKLRSFLDMCEEFKFKSFLSGKYFERWRKALVLS